MTDPSDDHHWGEVMLMVQVWAVSHYLIAMQKLQLSHGGDLESTGCTAPFAEEWGYICNPKQFPSNLEIHFPSNFECIREAQAAAVTSDLESTGCTAPLKIHLQFNTTWKYIFECIRNPALKIPSSSLLKTRKASLYCASSSALECWNFDVVDRKWL